MLITKTLIEQLNPCKDRLANFIEHYGTFNDNVIAFLDLQNITYDDKLWVARRLLNKTQSIEFACLCAESVLHIYEAKYPDDKRVRETISDARKGIYNGGAANAAYAAYAAAYAANAAAAYAADVADAAAAYAANAADAAAYAANAAYYAASAYYAAADAAYYATNAAEGRGKQEEKNIEMLKIAFTSGG